MFFQPSTLFELSLRVMCFAMDDATLIESLPLPLTVKYEMRSSIKSLWFNQRSICSDHYDYENFNLNEMSRWDFNMLMNYDEDLLGVPGFIPKKTTHVFWGFWVWEIGHVRTYNICESCVGYVSRLSGELALSQWGVPSANWKFLFVRKYIMFHPHNVFQMVIKKEKNFCDLCVICPLFRIMDRFDYFQ
jgi:hypothetical protein